MKYVTQIALFLSVLFTLSCSESNGVNKNDAPKKLSAEEYLKSIESSPELLPGVGLGKLRLEETRGEDLFSENVNGRIYIDKGIFLQYRNADTLTGITIENKTIYKTPDGKRIGLTETQILKELGEPESRGTKLNKGDTEIGSLPSLNYSGMMITFYEDSNRVIHLFKEK